MNFEVTTEAVIRLTRFKKLATGLPCSAFPAAEVAAAVTFEQFVTILYKWYGEQMREDVRHLRANAERSEQVAVDDFGRLLNHQRHVDQHVNYDGAAEARAWRANVVSSADGSVDRDRSEALLGELQQALENLCSIAARIAKDPAKRKAWSLLAASSPENEMGAVFANMGRGPQQRKFEYTVRQFKSHPDLRRATSPLERAQVAEMLAVGVTMTPLSLPYDEILDEFGLIGQPLGYALLVLAHGVQAAGATGPRLISTLHTVWEVVLTNEQ